MVRYFDERGDWAGPTCDAYRNWWSESRATVTLSATNLTSDQRRTRGFNDEFILPTFQNLLCDSSVGIVLCYGLDDRGSRVRFPVVGWEFFSSPPRPDRLWGPPNLLFNVYQELFPWG
jgi:hypothetical protein